MSTYIDFSVTKTESDRIHGVLVLESQSGFHELPFVARRPEDAHAKVIVCFPGEREKLLFFSLPADDRAEVVSDIEQALADRISDQKDWN